MNLASALVCSALVACGGAADDAEAQQPAAGGKTAFAIPADDMAQIARPFGTAHEALPAGVPLDYDWSRFSKRDGGNDIPSGYTAFTGWGQAFWIHGSTASGQAAEIRDNQTYLCTVREGTRAWERVQRGDIEGAAFRADYAGNDNVPATLVPLAAGQARVSFPAGRAFHYWPRQGRITLAAPALCGVVVVFQARAVAADGSDLPPAVQPALLVGGGGDYWLDTTAPWNQYQTNIGVGVGQLRRLTTQWRWYGMATAGSADLQSLLQQGFVDRTRQ